MARWHVQPSKWVWCVCGKCCKGRAAYANHARVCPKAIAEREAYLARIEGGR